MRLYYCGEKKKSVNEEECFQCQLERVSPELKGYPMTDLKDIAWNRSIDCIHKKSLEQGVKENVEGATA